MILALAGGVGGARLAKGLSDVLDAGELLVAVNVGDDFEHLGLYICPDLDTVMYTLAGINDTVQGWGIANETWNFMHALEALHGETWFRLGDRDLATHIERTMRLRAGQTLSQVTRHLCAQLGIAHGVVPISDDRVRTIVHTASGAMAFQDYFVRHRAQPEVTRIEFAGADTAQLAPDVSAVLSSPSLCAVVLCPSNPYLSIGPILATGGLRIALERRRVPVIAVSPIVAGRALKGPAAKIMRELGVEPSSLSIAKFYGGLIDALVIDRADGELSAKIEACGVRAVVTDTVMRDPDTRTALARTVVELARSSQMTRPVSRIP